MTELFCRIPVAGSKQHDITDLPFRKNMIAVKRYRPDETGVGTAGTLNNQQATDNDKKKSHEEEVNVYRIRV